ncbi:formin-like protein 3 isoform X1 [Coffea arabica]|uniref:Formin-like protein n=1 Tax=Coffea arabica TaxID=13443 RepID=A0ABM4UIA9_COFAR
MDVGMSRTNFLFVAFLCFFAASNLKGIRNFAEAFSGNEVSLDIEKIDYDKAEDVWIQCRRELKECLQFLESLELYLSQIPEPYENPTLPVDLLAKRIVQQTIPNLTFQDKQFLFECLRKKPLQNHESGKEFGSNTQFNKCPELFSSWSSAPRRFLRHHNHHVLSLVQAPGSPAASPHHAPAPSPVPASSPSPTLHSPSPVLQPRSPEPSPQQNVIHSPLPSSIVGPPPPQTGAPAPSGNGLDRIFGTAAIAASAVASPHHAPAPSPVPASSPSPTLHPPSPVLQPPPPESSPPQNVIHSPPPSSIVGPLPRPQTGAPTPSGNGLNRNYVIAAIAASAVTGLALIVLFLICCINKRKEQVAPGNGQKNEKRDEKPLLNFCSSDLSAGSTQKSQNIVAFNNQNLKMSSTVSNIPFAVNVVDSSTETQSTKLTNDASENVNSLLPLPPGRPALPRPGPPPPPPPKPPAPAPPPPPKVARPPPNPPKPSNLGRPSPPGANNPRSSSGGNTSELSGESDAPKAKLKPFFWEKVPANPDHSMVWHDIKAGSFQVNEEMMESLFGYVPAEKGKFEHKRNSSSESSVPYVQIIDPKKSQNLAILLKALNVTTEEVIDALKEGNELPIELVQALLKMAPTTDEELKLRLFSGDVSQLGPAERFLKVLVEIPFAFKRMESLLFMSSFQEESSSITESFATLEVACKELRNSRLFLKLLEAVLKLGNRMNDGTYRGGATAFKLDTLLKLSDVKGTDGKTTLLHFVVQEIIRSEGLRAARRLRESHSMSSVKTEDLVEESSEETADYYRSLGLQVVSGLSNDLENVRKAALIDGDDLAGAVSSLGQSFVKLKDFINNEMTNVEEDSEFRTTLTNFVEHAEADITKLLEEEKRIMALVKSTGDYFHGNAGKNEGLRLFLIVRDFLVMVDKACRDVRSSTKLPAKTPRKEALAPSPSEESNRESLPDFRQRLFPAIKERHMDDSSSDEDDKSP